MKVDQTPINQTERRLLHVSSSRLQEESGSLGEGKTTPCAESGKKSASRLKIDLSVVSFLKPHIVNEDVYKLAHKGVSRDQQLKTDLIKSIEQERRFKRFIGTYECRNNW